LDLGGFKMKIDIKELKLMIRKELIEAKAKQPTDISKIRSYLDVGKHEMRPADQGQRLGQTYLGPELDEPSPEDLDVDASLQAYYGIGGGDPDGLYSKLSKVARSHEKHLKALQGHRNAKKFNVDEILLILKQLNAAIDKGR
jgi:hypothetical protein